ncbi:MAG TPA: hypothetical protein VGM17_16920 [Rhizomicrobium sp.]
MLSGVEVVSAVLFAWRPSLGGALCVSCVSDAFGPPLLSAGRAELLATLPELPPRF